MSTTSTKTAPSARSLIAPLALAQFICSFAATNMNVAISDIAKSLNTTVHGVQFTITLFTLTMAALMIPGSKLTDIWGRKFCFVLGLSAYGVGAVVAALAHGLTVLIVGYSLLEGIGSSFLIPPVYILSTVFFMDPTLRARAFGVISGAGAIGAAAGPLIGGLITSTLSWRASFIVQALIVVAIISLSLRIVDPGIQGAKPRFDLVGAILSAVGLVFIVLGIQLSGTYGWWTASKDVTIGSTVVIAKGGISPVWPTVAIGLLILVWFYLHIQSRERAGKAPLLSPRILHNRVSNLGLVTQNVQWLIMQGSFFVVSVFLQTVGGYSAIQTGLILTPTTFGILLTARFAGRFAQRRAQSMLIRAGFVITIAGMILLLFLHDTSNVLTFAPGLFLMGAGVGVMLTFSVNVVQSAFPETDQGEISGLSRSVSNLGSALGTALAGSVLVSPMFSGNQAYGAAVVVLVVIAGIGLVAALLLPTTKPAPSEAARTAGGMSETVSSA